MPKSHIQDVENHWNKGIALPVYLNMMFLKKYFSHSLSENTIQYVVYTEEWRNKLHHN